jgi:hypothetical protein
MSVCLATPLYTYAIQPSFELPPPFMRVRYGCGLLRSTPGARDLPGIFSANSA